MEFKDEEILNNIITVILIIIILHIIFTMTCPLYNKYISNCKNNLRKLTSCSKNKKHKHVGVEKFSEENIYAQPEYIESKPNIEFKKYIEPKPYIPIISELSLPTYKPLETKTKKVDVEIPDNNHIRDSLLSSIYTSENENKIVPNVNILPDNIPAKQDVAIKKNTPLIDNIQMENKIVTHEDDSYLRNKHINMEYDKLHGEENIPIPHNTNDLYEYINGNDSKTSKNDSKSSKNEIHVHSTIEPIDYLPRHATFSHENESKPLKITNKLENNFMNDYISSTCCNDISEHDKIKPIISESKVGTDFYDNQVGEYLRDTLIGSQHYCGDDKNLSKKWDDDLKKERDKFFDFNNHINQNSNPNNMAFKVQKLYNENNLDVSLSKIYDNAVKESTVFEKQCVKTPIYDDLTKTGAYIREGTTGHTFLSDNWMYNNDKIINGGKISDNLYAYDPVDNNQAIY